MFPLFAANGNLQINKQNRPTEAQEKEAAILLKALSLYVFLKDQPQRDYIGMMKTQKKEETENE